MGEGRAGPGPAKRRCVPAAPGCVLRGSVRPQLPCGAGGERGTCGCERLRGRARERGGLMGKRREGNVSQANGLEEKSAALGSGGEEKRRNGKRWERGEWTAISLRYREGGGSERREPSARRGRGAAGGAPGRSGESGAEGSRGGAAADGSSCGRPAGAARGPTAAGRRQTARRSAARPDGHVSSGRDLSKPGERLLIYYPKHTPPPARPPPSFPPSPRPRRPRFPARSRAR